MNAQEGREAFPFNQNSFFFFFLKFVPSIVVYVPCILFVMAVLKQAYHCSSGLNAGVKGLFCYKKKIKKRDESMGGAL